MVLFLTLAIAATVVSPPFENKSSAEEVFSNCEALLDEWEGEHPIYMSRYLVSGQGYRYRITIDISTQFSQEQLQKLYQRGTKQKRNKVFLMSSNLQRV